MITKKDPFYAKIKYDKDIKSNWTHGRELFEGKIVKLVPEYRNGYTLKTTKRGVNLNIRYLIEGSTHFVWSHEFIEIRDKLGRLLYE